MDEWLEEWLDFHSERLRDGEDKKIRLKRAYRNFLVPFWHGNN
ncbi:MAG TPA: hypothetical protein QF802_01910 [Candidatus Thalassarchaeaceae archaeon]|jgi:hypothetical protein|nr:hypothetical protein [Candidatus Thalassarchaeaceae archaeon]HJM19197.1 hypothetical protein [Candidatus Thalassarchaeaceae archaeon]HJM87077.1 hypothetical protein [Candidatus Thalassarchaeaceae archaeon]